MMDWLHSSLTCNQAIIFISVDELSVSVLMVFMLIMFPHYMDLNCNLPIKRNFNLISILTDT